MRWRLRAGIVCSLICPSPVYRHRLYPGYFLVFRTGFSSSFHFLPSNMMKVISSYIKKTVLCGLAFQLAAGLAFAQNDFPAADSSSAANDGAVGNTSPITESKSSNRRIIYDRGNSIMGQPDPSGNSLPDEVSPYEYMGTHRQGRKAVARKTREFRDFGGSSIGQPDPSGNYNRPAEVVQTNDPYVSNSPDKDRPLNSFAPATDSTGTTATPAAWGNTAEPAADKSSQPRDNKNESRRGNGQKN